MNSRSYGRDKKTCSRSTIRIMFGSWGNALEEAGITAKDKKMYSKKIIKEHLWDHYKRNPKMTRTSFEKDKKVCSSGVVFIRFGVWTEKRGFYTLRKEMRIFLDFDYSKLLNIFVYFG